MLKQKSESTPNKKSIFTPYSLQVAFFFNNKFNNKNEQEF